MASRRENWTRAELIQAFNLYCRIPFGKIHNRNPEIISLALSIGRSASAVSWKLANFASLDPVHADRSVVGARHGSLKDKEIWDEFEHDWEKLTYESELLLCRNIPTAETEAFPEGKTREAQVRVRVNQGFFRSAVLAAYEGMCSITGVNVRELLCASHIIPWTVDINNRTNPRNGLCLNPFHDRAFDRGLITVTPDYTVQVASSLKTSAAAWHKELILKYDGAAIRLPKHFPPDQAFLRYHIDKIFKG